MLFFGLFSADSVKTGMLSINFCFVDHTLISFFMWSGNNYLCPILEVTGGKGTSAYCQLCSGAAPRCTVSLLREDSGASLSLSLNIFFWFRIFRRIHFLNEFKISLIFSISVTTLYLL